MSFINIPAYTWLSPVESTAELPSVGNRGDVRAVSNLALLYYFDGNSWGPIYNTSSASNSFVIVQTPSGTFPTATTATDTLTFTSTDSSITIIGNSGTDTIDFKVSSSFGVGSINSLSGTLTLTNGTSGTDFNINSVGSTITLNLPTTSITNTGKLSSSQYSNIEYEFAHDLTVSTYYKEFIYTGPDLTTINIWTTPGMTLKKYQKDFYYTLSDLTSIITTRVIDSATLTKTFGYTLGTLTSIDVA